MTLVKVREQSNTVYSCFSISRVISLSRGCEFSTSNLDATLLFDTMCISSFEIFPDMILYPILVVLIARNIMVHSFYTILKTIALKYMPSVYSAVYPDTSSTTVSRERNNNMDWPLGSTPRVPK